MSSVLWTMFYRLRTSQLAGTVPISIHNAFIWCPSSTDYARALMTWFLYADGHVARRHTTCYRSRTTVCQCLIVVCTSSSAMGRCWPCSSPSVTSPHRDDAMISKCQHIVITLSEATILGWCIWAVITRCITSSQYASRLSIACQSSLWWPWLANYNKIVV